MGVRSLAVAVAATALLAGAACGDSGEPEEFAKFADKVADAVEEGDVVFFTGRVQGESYTCTEEDVRASTGPEAPPQPICLEVGYEFEAVAIANYGTAGTITTPKVLIGDIQRFFQGALPGQEDDYGPGAVRLYATAIPNRRGAAEAGVHTAILTAIQDFQGQPRRFARAIDFEYIDGRWMITGETTAGFPIAVDLLEPSSAAAIYDEWTEY